MRTLNVVVVVVVVRLLTFLHILYSIYPMVDAAKGIRDTEMSREYIRRQLGRMTARPGSQALRRLLPLSHQSRERSIPKARLLN